MDRKSVAALRGLYMKRNIKPVLKIYVGDGTNN
jgi:hypothetical protein